MTRVTANAADVAKVTALLLVKALARNALAVVAPLAPSVARADKNAALDLAELMPMYVHHRSVEARTAKANELFCQKSASKEFALHFPHTETRAYCEVRQVGKLAMQPKMSVEVPLAAKLMRKAYNLYRCRGGVQRTTSYKYYFVPLGIGVVRRKVPRFNRCSEDSASRLHQTSNQE